MLEIIEFNKDKNMEELIEFLEVRGLKNKLIV